MSSVSIIGLGGMARALGARAIENGIAVEVVGRDAAKAEDLAAALGSGATAGTFGATPAGGLVILAVPHSGAVATVARYGEALAGKVVVDVSNTFAGAEDTVLVTPEGTSGAQEIAKAVPASAQVVKAFNTVFGHVLARGGALDVLVAGDDAAAKATVAEFVESLGLRPRDVGGLEMAHWLEGTGLLLMGLARSDTGFDVALGVEVLSGPLADPDDGHDLTAAPDYVATLEEFIGATDRSTALAMVDERAVWREAESLPWGGEWRGPDGFFRLTQEIDAVAELTVDGHEIVQAGEVVELRLDAAFTSRRSGRRLPMTVVEHYRVRDGKIHGADAFYRDTQAVNDLVEHG